MFHILMDAHFRKNKTALRFIKVLLQRCPAGHPTNLELLPQLGGIALGVYSQHLFVGDGKLVHQDGRLSTQTGLQNGIVDKDILLLKGQQITVHGCGHAVLQLVSADRCVVRGYKWLHRNDKERRLRQHQDVYKCRCEYIIKQCEEWQGFFITWLVMN